jgi:spore germination protein KC
MNSRFPRMISCLLILTTLLMGCEGKREINDLALVMAVGLDKGDKEGNVKITAQVARPADSRGQTGAPSGVTGDPLWTASAEGESIFDAIRNLARFSSRRVFWAHNYIIIINEDLAKEGIKEIIDFFTRNPELRMRTWVVVTPDKAQTVASTLTGLEVIPGEALDKLFRYTKYSNVAPRTQMLHLQSAFLSESTEPVLARVKLIKRGVSNKKPGQAGDIKQVELAGAGVFKGDKLVGSLSPKETSGLLMFIEEPESGLLVLKCPKEPDKALTVEFINQRLTIKPSYKNGLPEFHINFQTDVNAVEAGCPFSLKDRAELEQLEKEIQKKIKNNIQTVVNKAQNEFKSDFLELGKVFQNKYPSEWKKIKDDWDTVFTESTVHIHVKADVRSGVLLFNPTKSKK